MPNSYKDKLSLLLGNPTIVDNNRIYFIGNESFDKQDLLSEIKSNQQNFILIFRNENYKEYQVNNDVYLLKDFYRNNQLRIPRNITREKNKFSGLIKEIKRINKNMEKFV